MKENRPREDDQFVIQTDVEVLIQWFDVREKILVDVTPIVLNSSIYC